MIPVSPGTVRIRMQAMMSCLLVLSACSSPTTQLTSCGNVAMTYRYPGETSIGERYEGARWWRIDSQNAPAAAVQEGEPPTADPGEPIFPVVNCSSKEYVCARTYRHVFAAPRAEIKDGATYIVEGSSLSVQGCLRSENGRCETAVLISDCRSVDSAMRKRAAVGAIVGKDCRATGWGQQIVFIFDRDRGVIAYEQADWWKPGTDVSRWDISTLGKSAGLLALVETRGLLSCEIDSSQHL